ncbi:hypothetical protein HMPREF0555_1666 [Leuconostoc mesenteroides subsp. cremoris ATCC 19254]|uniref:Uncharacterized protein n=1 Tax=Leuconostoc mesenteroides subsp. cremoris ATCC 19254 TaxID=586220 RepID=C2KM00_LEUMC|nr:hypothetical protein HMPREF0555_1666 [Leuconostoc mesenteroides subsp. cremoris ATCC 19254]
MLLFIEKEKILMAEKNDLSSAYRRLKSPNAKTRDRVLKLLKEIKAKKSQKSK